MFQALKPLLAAGKLLIELSENSDGTINALVSQKGDGPLATPLPLTATAEEFDEKFADIITKYGVARKSLEEQLATTTAILDAAKKESSTKATKTLSRSSAMVDKPSNQSGMDDDDEGDDEAVAAVTGSVSKPIQQPADDGLNLFADLPQ